MLSELSSALIALHSALKKCPLKSTPTPFPKTYKLLNLNTILSGMNVALFSVEITVEVFPMKKLMIISLLFLMGTLGTAGKSQAYTNASFSFSFHDALDPYGSWVNVSSYGNVFRPHVAAGWRPYSAGHWIYTDYGPMWDSPEPYGWATYHYGRWIFTASYGWVWIPGYEYYPSRVTWAYGDDYLGWSPIYPNPGYSNTNLWVFIDRDHYGYGDYSPYYLRGDRIRPLLDSRVIRVRESRWDRDDFERVVRRPVQVVKVRERSFEADQRRVRMVVPEHRESQVVREVTRASKVRRADADRSDNSRSKVVVKQSSEKSRQLSSSKRPEFKQSSESKVVVKNPPKSQTTRKLESNNDSNRKAFIKRTPPKNSQASQSKFSSNRKVEVKQSSKSKAFVKSTAPKKSSASPAKFTSKKPELKPKTQYTSSKKIESSKQTSKQKVDSKKTTQKKAVKKPSSKSNKKRKPS